MTVSADNFKLYKSTVWAADNDTEGGVISANEITSGVDQGIFDDVTDLERSGGDIEYRKVFFKNCTGNDTVSIKVFISTVYTATNQHIAICAGTASGVRNTAGEGADAGATYVAPTTLVTGLDLGSIAENTSKAVWIRRTVDSGGNGITADTFGLTFGMY